jgi:branched-chain amino acid transport system permease protein
VSAKASAGARLRSLAVTQSELGVLAAILVACLLLPKGLPLGIGALGLSSGCAIALQAMAIVLVYRANRIINFAQLAAGALGVTLFSELVRRQSFILIGHLICGSCVPTIRVSELGSVHTVPVDVPGWAFQLNYWLAVVSGLLLALLASMMLFGVIHIRRLLTAPRVIVTVFTIGAAQVFGLGSALLLKWFGEKTATVSVSLPFAWNFTVGGVRLGAAEVLTVVALAVSAVWLTLYLSRATVGVLLRGAAENPARAGTLGVNVTAVNARAWGAAAALAGVGAVLGAVSPGGGAAASGLIPVLAAAVVGRLTSLPLAVLAGLVLGVVEHAALWSFNTIAAVDGVAFAIIIVVLLAQRARAGRVDTADSGWAQTLELRPVPAELRDVAPVVRWRRFIRLSALGAVLGLPWVLSPSQTTLTVVVVVYAVIGMSLLILTGWAGQISLGQLAIAAVGGYVTALVHAPFPLPLVVGGLAGAVAALVVGLPALRLRGLHLAISTFAFGAAVASLLLSPSELGRYLPSYVARPSFLGFDLKDDRTLYYVALVILLLTYLATVGMRRSRTGRALIACRENDALAQAYGINLVRARLSAFMVAGFMAAVGGSIYAYASYGVSPDNFGVQQSISVFVLAVIGGLGSVVGPLLGAIYIGATTVFSSNDLLALASTGLGLTAVLLFAPGGLAQLAFDLRDAFLRRVAERYKIDVPSLFADRLRSKERSAPISAKQRPGGGSAFVPVRYAPADQWAVDLLQREHARG